MRKAAQCGDHANDRPHHQRDREHPPASGSCAKNAALANDIDNSRPSSLSQLAAELRVALQLIEIMGELDCPNCVGTRYDGLATPVGPCRACDETGMLLAWARRKMETEK